MGQSDAGAAVGFCGNCPLARQNTRSRCRSRMRSSFCCVAHRLVVAGNARRAAGELGGSGAGRESPAPLVGDWRGAARAVHPGLGVVWLPHRLVPHPAQPAKPCAAPSLPSHRRLPPPPPFTASPKLPPYPRWVLFFVPSFWWSLLLRAARLVAVPQPDLAPRVSGRDEQLGGARVPRAREDALWHELRRRVRAP